jgi:hypothetical protein
MKVRFNLVICRRDVVRTLALGTSRWAARPSCQNLR